MGWTISTYSGLKANGTGGNWRVGMFELCRAVNERQGAAAITKTQFYKGDGTQGSDLAYSDFLGLVTSGASSKVETNLLRIQAAIKAMASSGNFYQATGRSTVWSVAALESAIGSSFLAAPESATHAAYWQQLKDALDLLLYVGKTATFGHSTSSFLPGVVGSFDTYQESWDASLLETPGSSTFSGYDLRLGMDNFSDPPGGDLRARIIYSSPLSWGLSGAGALTSVYYNYTITENHTGALDSPPTISIGSTSFTAPTTTGEQAGSTGDFTLGGSGSITIQIPTIPTTYPLLEPGAAIDAMVWDMAVDTLEYYFDIAGELTDQS